MKKIILDVDAGIDDALALLAIPWLPVELLGVTVLAGNVDLDTATANASGIVDRFRLNTQVYKGASTPLYGQGQHATDIHGSGGLGDWQVAPAPQRIASEHAVEFIAATARAYPGQVTLIATGPLTNVALAWEHHAQDMRALANIVLMGGALNVAGNTTPVAEFNMFYDPDAADIVFNSGLPLTMIGLDVTHQVYLQAADLQGFTTTSRARAAKKMVEFYLRSQPKIPLHDPLALLAALRPDLFDFKSVPVQVELQGQLTRGQTIADPGHKGPSLKVATKVDSQACKKALIECWTR